MGKGNEYNNMKNKRQLYYSRLICTCFPINALLLFKLYQMSHEKALKGCEKDGNVIGN